MPIIIKAALAAAPQQSWAPPGVVTWGCQLKLLPPTTHHAALLPAGSAGGSTGVM